MWIRGPIDEIVRYKELKPGLNTIDLPYDADILTFKVWDGELIMYYRAETNINNRERRILVVSTEDKYTVPEDYRAEYIGTIMYEYASDPAAEYHAFEFVSTMPTAVMD